MSPREGAKRVTRNHSRAAELPATSRNMCMICDAPIPSWPLSRRRSRRRRRYMADRITSDVREAGRGEPRDATKIEARTTRSFAIVDFPESKISKRKRIRKKKCLGQSRRKKTFLPPCSPNLLLGAANNLARPRCVAGLAIMSSRESPACRRRRRRDLRNDVEAAFPAPNAASRPAHLLAGAPAGRLHAARPRMHAAEMVHVNSCSLGRVCESV